MIQLNLHPLPQQECEKIATLLNSHSLELALKVVASRALVAQQEYLRFSVRGVGYDAQKQDALDKFRKYSNTLSVFSELLSGKMNDMQIAEAVLTTKPLIQ